MPRDYAQGIVDRLPPHIRPTPPSPPPPPSPLPPSVSSTSRAATGASLPRIVSHQAWIEGGVTVDGGHRIISDLSCGHCGESLRKRKVTGSCPRCGRPVARSIVGRGGVCRVDDANRLAEHVECRGCGADLIAQSAHTGCSQCGAQTWRSFTPDLLRYIPSGWLKVLAGSIAGLLLFMPLFYLLTWIIDGMNAASQTLGALGTIDTSSIGRGITYLLYCVVISEILYLWYLFRLTRPSPPETGIETDNVWRWTMRGLCIAAIILNSIAAFRMAHTSDLAAAVNFGTSPPAILIDTINQALFVFIMLYVARLAWIIPDGKLSRQCAVLGYLYAAVELFCLAISIVGVIHIMGHHAAGAAGAGGGGGAVTEEQRQMAELQKYLGNSGLGGGQLGELLQADQQGDTGLGFFGSSLGCIGGTTLFVLNCVGWYYLWLFRRALLEGVHQARALLRQHPTHAPTIIK